MMGVHVEQKSLFSYSVNLEKRIRSDNPLRRIAEVIDFSFVRDEVRDLYGQNGHESVDPETIHVDGSVIAAEASQASQASQASVVRHSKQGSDGVSRPRYKQHRGVDDDYGVITAQTTTPEDIEENVQLELIIDQHEANVGHSLRTVVGDKQYGTVENYRQLQKRGLNTHMDHGNPGNKKALAAIYPLSDFIYQNESDTYTCPAGQTLHWRRHDPIRKSTEYKARKGVCAQCPVKSQCTKAKAGRTVARHDFQELVTRGRVQAKSKAAKKNRIRRRYLGEGSFGQAADNHHFKRGRWRRLWRQQIQDDLIASIQNIKILIKYAQPKPAQAGSGVVEADCLELRGVKRPHGPIELLIRSLRRLFVFN